MWPNGVVPLWMERIPLDVDTPQLFVGNLFLCLVLVLIQYRLDLQPRLGRGVSDKLQHHLVGNERPSSPVTIDEGKHLMLNRVPLAGAGRVVADMDNQLCCGSLLLQAILPELVV
jgi:hypothetical protein